MARCADDAHPYSPVNKHATTGIKAILNELVASWEVFQQVFVIDIVNFNHFVSEAFELFLVQRQSQNRYYVRNSAIL